MVESRTEFVPKIRYFSERSRIFQNLTTGQRPRIIPKEQDT